MNQHVVSYFSELFSSDSPDMQSSVFDKVPCKVSQAMNSALIEPFTLEDVKAALFSIGDLKAPGPDGLHAVFYKRFWHILGDDLVGEVLAAVNSYTIPEGWDDTTIVMIPKVKSPEKVTEFRPISLCNVVYKVI